MASALWDDGIQESAENTANTYYDTEDCLIYYLEYLTESQRIAVLDAICDQIVTAVGVAYMMGMDIEGALAEVNRSNWSKFKGGLP